MYWDGPMRVHFSYLMTGARNPSQENIYISGPELERIMCEEITKLIHQALPEDIQTSSRR